MSIEQSFEMMIEDIENEIEELMSILEDMEDDDEIEFDLEETDEFLRGS